VAAFLACWVNEEPFTDRPSSASWRPPGTRSARADAPRPREPRAVAGARGTAILSRLWPNFCAVHMTWGAINELARSWANRRLGTLTALPVLAEMLDAIMRDDSPGTSFFYYRSGEIRLRRPAVARVSRWLVDRFWGPVGSGVQPRTELRFMPAYLFSDAEGVAAARKVDGLFDVCRFCHRAAPRGLAGPGTSNGGRNGNRHTDHTAPTLPSLHRAERDSVTDPVRGSALGIDAISTGVLEASGYQVRRSFPVATKDDLVTGREVRRHRAVLPEASPPATPVNFLKKEAKQTNVEDVSKKFIYLTAGSCGACRFGQYHQSYELGLEQRPGRVPHVSSWRRTT